VLGRLFRRVGRWFSPTVLVLAGLCFLLPFATVACDTPGGYGRAAPGGTTAYTGVDLITGGAPDVTPADKVRPAAEQREDRLPPQPVATIVVLLVVAGAVMAVVAADARVRRAAAAVFATGAVILLVVNQALVESALAAQVREQLTQPLPAGKVVRDYVKTGEGFGFSFLLLTTVVAVNAIGWFRLRSRGAPAAVASAPVSDTITAPTVSRVDPGPT
jgi:hypothetical protein